MYTPDYYNDELARWSNASYQQEHTHHFQLPFVVPTITPADQDIAVTQRKIASARRLLDYHQKKNDEKIAALEARLLVLQALQDDLAMDDYGMEQVW